MAGGVSELRPPPEHEGVILHWISDDGDTPWVWEWLPGDGGGWATQIAEGYFHYSPAEMYRAGGRYLGPARCPTQGLTFADGQRMSDMAEIARLENQIVAYQANIGIITAQLKAAQDQLANALDENKRLMRDLSKLMHAAAHPPEIPHQEPDEYSGEWR